jgi:hypothetical protein
MNSTNLHLVDGYIAYTFEPSATQNYFSILLRRNSSRIQAIQYSDSSIRFTDERGYQYLLDYRVGQNTGTVVPQSIWEPHLKGDWQRHVADVQLQYPIFFRQGQGNGIRLRDALAGSVDRIENSRMPSQLGNRTTTHLCLRVGHFH